MLGSPVVTLRRAQVVPCDHTIRGLQCPSSYRFHGLGERVFVIAPLAAKPRPENPFIYGELASGATYVESDPIGLAGGSFSTYAYVNGNPVLLIDPYGLWDWPSLPQGVVNASAGFGDTLSFGLTNQIRNWQRTNGVVDKCSNSYTAGQFAAIALDVGLGGAAGMAASEANAGRAGYEFSHWIPNRFGGPRSPWNGNYVSQELHYLTDPYRFPPGWQQYGDKLPAALQQLLRIPGVYPGAAAGGAAGAASAASQSCGCQK